MQFLWDIHHFLLFRSRLSKSFRTLTSICDNRQAINRRYCPKNLLLAILKQELFDWTLFSSERK